MKKSKIIVPALGIILLSTVASVTGTVAWFTANTRFHTNVTQFEVARLQGDLSCKNIAGYGTSVTNNVVSVSADTKFTDASFDHTTGTIWTPTDRAFDSTHSILEFTKKYDNSGTPTDRGVYFDGTPAGWEAATIDSVKYVYAVTWQMQFSLQFGTASSVQSLYLGVSGTSGKTSLVTSTKVANAKESATEQTWKAFRIAFINDTEGDKTTKVWGYSATASSMKFINTGSYTAVANSNVGTAYGTNIAIGSGETADLTTADANANTYLGKISKPSTGDVGTLTITCVAWFEGTDPNVINQAEMDSVAATLDFYTLAGPNS